jgi:hypothetical protein
MTSYLKKNLGLDHNGYTPLRYIHSDRQWMTRDEQDFIRMLGSNALTPTRSAPRRVLLARYLAAAERRADWGLMDKAACIATATALLKEDV